MRAAAQALALPILALLAFAALLCVCGFIALGDWVAGREA
jgi:hypothetical protein